MRGGMLEPVCTSLVEMADKVSSDKKKGTRKARMAQCVLNTQSQEGANISSFSIPEEKGNKN